MHNLIFYHIAPCGRQLMVVIQSRFFQAIIKKEGLSIKMTRAFDAETS